MNVDIDFQSYFERDTIRIDEAKDAKILTHLTHLEELILTKQEAGVDLAVNFIRELLSVLGGNTKSKTYTTIKFDGSVSLIFGYNPENGRFFVATKSLANAVPKVNYTLQDIEMNHGHAPGLVEKLKFALKFLPKVTQQGIYQADFMFDQNSLFEFNRDGIIYLAFKPNVIVYAIDAQSDLAKIIKRARIGIVVHTRYSGKSLTDLQQSMGVTSEEFGKSPDVWIEDVRFKDYSGIATLTAEESHVIREQLARLHSAKVSVEWDQIPPTFYQLVNTFINSLIRKGRFVEDPESEFEQFILWIAERYNKEIDSVKTELSKGKKAQSRDQVLQNLEKHKVNYINLFLITSIIADIKMKLVRKYNAAIKTKQFLQDPETGDLTVTAPEGYVAVDHMGNAVKLVDRLEFSKANFTQPKSWK